jgi:hypothetical protein
MFIHTPRVRMDGVYVSFCYYTSGVASGVGRVERRFAATAGKSTKGLKARTLLYRYLRFYCSGAAIGLTTDLPPPQVMRNFTPKSSYNELRPGWYEMRAGKLHVRLTHKLKSHPDMMPSEHRVYFDVRSSEADLANNELRLLRMQTVSARGERDRGFRGFTRTPWAASYAPVYRVYGVF